MLATDCLRAWLLPSAALLDADWRVWYCSTGPSTNAPERRASTGAGSRRTGDCERRRACRRRVGEPGTAAAADAAAEVVVSIRVGGITLFARRWPPFFFPAAELELIPLLPVFEDAVLRLCAVSWALLSSAT